MNIYYSVCFPKYLGLPVLKKYFVKNCLFVSWGRPQFSLFYPNIGPLLHLQYLKIHKKALPQSYRYGKYLSFAALVTPITFLGAEQFAFPCTLFFAELQLKKFWAWAETKTGLCWGRITAKASDTFQTFWIFNMFTCSNSIPSCVLAICIMGLNMNMWTCWRSKMFEKCQMGKVVQHCENILNPSLD